MKTPIAGAAMGLIKGEDKFAILTDIAGLEDHLGDMDFKVAGSRAGVTALQMDIKVKGITLAIISEALEQATEARLQILDVMQECIAEPRAELAAHAPRMSRVEVPPTRSGRSLAPAGGPSASWKRTRAPALMLRTAVESSSRRRMRSRAEGH